jgi:hypothetical protein
VRESYEQFKKRNVEIFIVTPHDEEYLTKYKDTLSSYPFPFYGDSTLTLYNNLGHQSLSKWKLFIHSVSSLFKGNFTLPSNAQDKKAVKEAIKKSDVEVQGGAWLFDSNNEVVWHHIDKSPNDHADISTLIEKANSL